MYRRFFQNSAVIVCCFLLSVSCKNEDKTQFNYSTIWRGFHHVWEYNHRVNRMGDWLSDISYQDGYTANSYHSAASGIGPDKNEYATFLTSLRTSTNVHFNTVNHEFVLQGVEGTIDSQSVTVTVDFPLIPNPKAVILLNGFDMYSRPLGSVGLRGDGDADKLFDLSINRSNILTNNTANSTQVSFTIDATLGGDCTSPECSSGADNDWFDYLLTTHFQIICAESSFLEETIESIHQNYLWERPMNNGANELFEEDYLIDDVEINGTSGIETAFIGISGFDFRISKGFGGFSGQSFEFPHMQTFNIALHQNDYNSTNGTVLLDSDLFFKNWAHPVPIFSFGGGGSLEMSVDVALVQINDEQAMVEQYDLKDDIIWLTNPLNPSPPNIEQSINWIPINSPK